MADLSLAELAPGKPIKFEKNGESICVARVGDEVFAIADTCSHSDASLAEGEIDGYNIECWLHGATFDLRTGNPNTPPALIPVKKYSVTIDGDAVTIEG